MAYGFTEYPVPFKRQGSFPLDKFTVFTDKEKLNEYAKSHKAAYAGQIVALNAPQGTTIHFLQKSNKKDTNFDLIPITPASDLVDIEDAMYYNSYEVPTDIGGIKAGETFEYGKTVKQMFDKLLYPNLTPSVKFEAMGNTINKIGTTITPGFQISITRQTHQLQYANLYMSLNSSSLPIVEIDLPELELGQTFSHSFDLDSTYNINENCTFTLNVADMDNNHTYVEITYKFIYPMYFGLQDINDISYLDITKLNEDIEEKNDKIISYSIQNKNERYIFMYPEEYGDLESIQHVEIGNIEYIHDFTKYKKDIDTNKQLEIPSAYQSQILQTQYKQGDVWLLADDFTTRHYSSALPWGYDTDNNYISAVKGKYLRALKNAPDNYLDYFNQWDSGSEPISYFKEYFEILDEITLFATKRYIVYIFNNNLIPHNVNDTLIFKFKE